MKKVFDNEVILPEVARLIEQGHSVTIPVRGNSMNPFLADGRDCVTLGGFVPEELQTGVTVLAKDMEGRFVLHRIIARRMINLYCKATATCNKPRKQFLRKLQGR